ncbi:MAG: VF530 family DNA-binding protein [Planctomycetota bacterium]|nr:VF530 family DNA-binding protein [Planctomycetota bacterium]
MVEDLVARRGWPDLAAEIPIGCFARNPSVGSSLAFLRKTPWARTKVEDLYIRDHRKMARNAKRNRLRKARKAYAAEQQARPQPPADEASGA